MGHIIKQKMLIGSGENSIETDLASNINFTFDMDELVGTLGFNLPYIKFSELSVDLTRLKKGDTVKLYYGDFDSDPGEISYTALTKVFDGFVDSIKLAKAKGSINYSLECFGLLGLGNSRKLERATSEMNGPVEMVNTLLQLSGLQEGEIASQGNIPAINVFPPENVIGIDTDAGTLFIKTTGGQSLMDELRNMRKNYALIIHNAGDGKIYVITPTQLLSQPDQLNLNAWEFRLNDNMWEIDYGEVQNDINSVICLGRPPIVGYAVDPAAVQLNAGPGVTPGPQNYSYISIERRDLTSEEDCESVARNTLLEIERNYIVSFRTLFKPQFMIGQPVVIYDDDRYPDGKIFFIKKYTVTISKDDVSCYMSVYANSLTVLPEELVLSPTGIADVDVLDVQYDIANAVGWGEGGFY